MDFKKDKKSLIDRTEVSTQSLSHIFRPVQVNSPQSSRNINSAGLSLSGYTRNKKLVFIDKQGKLKRNNSIASYRGSATDDFNFITSPLRPKGKNLHQVNSKVMLKPYNARVQCELSNYFGEIGAHKCGPIKSKDYEYGCISQGVRAQRRKFQEDIASQLNKINGESYFFVFFLRILHSE